MYGFLRWGYDQFDTPKIVSKGPDNFLKYKGFFAYLADAIEIVFIKILKDFYQTSLGIDLDGGHTYLPITFYD
jgi:hypothetical protein